MSQYPSIGMYVAPPTYTYKPPEVKSAQEEVPTDLEEVKVHAMVKSHPMALLAEELDHPSQNNEFLDLFDKSAKKVEDLGNSLKKASVGLGVVGLVCFGVAAVTFLGNTVQAMQQSSAMVQARNKNLQAGLEDMNFD